MGMFLHSPEFLSVIKPRKCNLRKGYWDLRDFETAICVSRYFHQVSLGILLRKVEKIVFQY